MWSLVFFTVYITLKTSRGVTFYTSNAVCRSLQQHVDTLNGKLADSTLQIAQLKAEMDLLHSAHSEGQHDAGNSKNSAASEADRADHDMQLHHADSARDIDNLRAQARSHTHIASDLTGGCLEFKLPTTARPSLQYDVVHDFCSRQQQPLSSVHYLHAAFHLLARQRGHVGNDITQYLLCSGDSA